MLQEIKEKIAELATELQQMVYFSYELNCDAINDTYPRTSEQYRVSCAGYKIIYRLTINQVLQLTKDNFVKSEGNTNGSI